MKSKSNEEKFHEMIGHCGVNSLKKTAYIHGLKLKGEVNECEDCALANTKQRNVNQDWKGESHVLGDRDYLDKSSINGKGFGGSCFWS
jgi:hypothetical protein